jgi:hypothetical protein
MRKLLNFKAVAVIQVLAVSGLFISWWLIRTASYVKAPLGPHDEYYPHNWGFQLIVGALYYVPLLALTAGVIILERWLLDLFFKAKESESDLLDDLDRVERTMLEESDGNVGGDLSGSEADGRQ